VKQVQAICSSASPDDIRKLLYHFKDDCEAAVDALLSGERERENLGFYCLLIFLILLDTAAQILNEWDDSAAQKKKSKKVSVERQRQTEN